MLLGESLRLGLRFKLLLPRTLLIRTTQKSISPILVSHFVYTPSLCRGLCSNITYTSSSSSLHNTMGEDSTRPSKRRKVDEQEPNCEATPNNAKRRRSDGEVDEPHRGDVIVVASGDASGSGSTTKASKKDKNMSRSEYRRKGKGRRRGTRNDDADADVGASQSNEPKTPRLPKRQCALLIGFCGAGYNGMQM